MLFLVVPQRLIGIVHPGGCRKIACNLLAGSQAAGETIHPHLAHAELVDTHLARVGCQSNRSRRSAEKALLRATLQKKGPLQTASKRLHLCNCKPPFVTRPLLLPGRLHAIECPSWIHADSLAMVKETRCHGLKCRQSYCLRSVLRRQLPGKRRGSLRLPCSIRCFALCHARAHADDPPQSGSLLASGVDRLAQRRERRLAALICLAPTR
mmetsp:Transcript_20300/g.41311  ORF Transcript_20300/g.41311 Transcript_20300/m.41311 type:complete len:210 (+) Transcript_20300:33-662(+)